MNKQERIHALMQLLQASLDGKEIEQGDCGWWDKIDIGNVDLTNVHLCRVKPNVVAKKYRVALFKPGFGTTDVYTITGEYMEKTVESNPNFIRWLGDWQTYTVEEE